MYGWGNREEWEEVAGGKFNANGLRQTGRSVAAITPHPEAKGLGNEYRVNLGRRIQNAVNYLLLT